MSRIRDFLVKCVEDGCTPGLQYAIGDADQVLEQGCIGTLDGINPVTDESLYDMASLTKIFTTLAVLRLLEQGKLCLGDKVAEFIPEIDDFFPTYEGNEKGNVTIKELMTHRSKISGFLQLFRCCKNKDEVLEMIKTIRPRDMAHEPVEYSCTGFILIGEIISRITGKPLDQAVRELVWEPLGMKYSCYNPSPDLIDRIAPTAFCHWRNQIVRGQVHDENALVMGGVSANAGIFSNVQDVLLIGETMLRGTTRTGERFLHPRTMEMMTVNYTPGMNDARGIGWQLHTEAGHNPYGDLMTPGTFGHTGFTGSIITIDPNLGIYTVLISNRVYPDRTNEKFFRCRRIFNNLAVLEYR